MSDSEILLRRVRKCSRDKTLALVCADALMEERGVGRFTALRIVQRARTARRNARRFLRAVKLIASRTHRSARVRTTVCRALWELVAATVPIDVVAGGRPPVLRGERPYYTFASGGICHSPGAARRAGYRVVYHRSTQRITVGAMWILRRA